MNYIQGQQLKIFRRNVRLVGQTTREIASEIRSLSVTEVSMSISSVYFRRARLSSSFERVR